MRQHLDTYLFFTVLRLILASQWNQMLVEQSIEFLSKRGELIAVGELDRSRSDDGLEELSLQDDLLLVMDVIWLDAQLLVQLSGALFLLFFVFRRLITIGIVRSRVLGIVKVIKLAHLVAHQQRKVVFLAGVVDSVELC